MVEIIRERNPKFMDELRRDFVPFDVTEGDFLCGAQLPSGKILYANRRQRRIRYISADQNSLCETADDLGPATGEEAVRIPCDGAVEIAQVIELLDWHKRKMADLEARRAWVEPLRTASWLDWLNSRREEVAKQQTGLTTVGPFVRVQREGVAK